MPARIRDFSWGGLCVLLSMILTPAALAAEKDASDAMLGLWETADGKARVEVHREKGDAGQGSYEGKIVWLKEPNFEGPGPEHGDPLRDANNPDKARQHDPVMGLVVLKGFQYNARKRRWQGGTVYDPEVGKGYSAVIKLRVDKKDTIKPMLVIRGYVGIRLFGRTAVWTRVNGDAVQAVAAE